MVRNRDLEDTSWVLGVDMEDFEGWLTSAILWDELFFDLLDLSRRIYRIPDYRTDYTVLYRYVPNESLETFFYLPVQKRECGQHFRAPHQLKWITHTYME